MELEPKTQRTLFLGGLSSLMLALMAVALILATINAAIRFQPVTYFYETSTWAAIGGVSVVTLASTECIVRLGRLRRGLQEIALRRLGLSQFLIFSSLPPGQLVAQIDASRQPRLVEYQRDIAITLNKLADSIVLDAEKYPSPWKEEAAKKASGLALAALNDTGEHLRELVYTALPDLLTSFRRDIGISTDILDKLEARLGILGVQLALADQLPHAEVPSWLEPSGIAGSETGLDKLQVYLTAQWTSVHRFVIYAVSLAISFATFGVRDLLLVWIAGLVSALVTMLLSPVASRLLGPM